MTQHNWEHYHLDEKSADSDKVNESAYSFYDFEDHEIEQMEQDRIASLKENDDSDSTSDTKPKSLPTPAPKEDATAVADIQEAKERTTAYEKNNDLDLNKSFENTKPAAGVVTSDSTTSAKQAAQSFLDNKKYQFIAK